jgi:hypothetical protein
MLNSTLTLSADESADLAPDDKAVRPEEPQPNTDRKQRLHTPNVFIKRWVPTAERKNESEPPPERPSKPSAPRPSGRLYRGREDRCDLECATGWRALSFYRRSAEIAAGFSWLTEGASKSDVLICAPSTGTRAPS